MTQTQWIGKQRFVTLGKSLSDDHIHVIQLQFEHDGYAEVRSLQRLGHTDRDDTEVQAEEAEREAREIQREQLLAEYFDIRQNKNFSAKRNNELIDELKSMY